jgi:hypothetical protein
VVRTESSATLEVESHEEDQSEVFELAFSSRSISAGPDKVSGTDFRQSYLLAFLPQF